MEEAQKKRLVPLFSYGTFHFIDDGFSDSIYILLIVCRRGNWQALLWFSGGMDRDCPHGLGDGNSHLRRNAFLDLVPNSDGLVPASSGRLYVERDLFSALCHSRGAHLRQCSRGYGLYYAITLGSSAIAPLVYGVVTDSLGLVFTMVTAGLFVLLTLPLSLFLASK